MSQEGEVTPGGTEASGDDAELVPEACRGIETPCDAIFISQSLPHTFTMLVFSYMFYTV